MKGYFITIYHTKLYNNAIYNELLKAYLANDLEYIEKCNNRVIESNSYSDTEIEIILILHNILTGAYEEVEKSIDRMDTIRNTLTSEELMFLGFLKIVFYKESCQYDIMCEEIDLIFEKKKNGK